MVRPGGGTLRYCDILFACNQYMHSLNGKPLRERVCIRPHSTTTISRSRYLSPEGDMVQGGIPPPSLLFLRDIDVPPLGSTAPFYQLADEELASLRFSSRLHPCGNEATCLHKSPLVTLLLSGRRLGYFPRQVRKTPVLPDVFTQGMQGGGGCRFPR